MRDLEIKRVALGIQGAKARKRISRGEQRPVAVVAHALIEVLGSCTQVHHRAAVRKVAPALRIEYRAATGCQHHAVRGGEIGDRLRLSEAEARLALDLEDYRDLHPAARLDLMI